VHSISKAIGTKDIESVSYESVPDEWKEFLNINLKMKTSVLFKDHEPPEDAKDPEEEAKKLKFPWHCKKGFLGN